jgi:tetratricopeptide (TPR) repeat protein
VENLAASIYKQGEIANEAQDYRAAADHFLRIRSAAPTSKIRATAEYDAGAALMELQAWAEAAGVLETFRGDYPAHELNVEATRLIAYAYRENGDSLRAADEYANLASQSGDPALRGDALLVAGDLYEQSNAPRRALEAYSRYVEEFPTPVEPALETRFKIAELHKAEREDALYREQLETIVRIDADSGPERTPRTRTLAARSALVLAEGLYREFVAVRLSQPFEASLQEKNRLMEGVMDSMNRLVSYEIAEITAAATYYMAGTYQDFSRALADSERPTDLQPAELAEYELALEEEAFPFEEKAIEFHEKNLELLQAGVFNPWTEKSLGELAGLVPGRYAKAEMSTGFLGAIDRYVYRSPASRMSSPVAGLVEVAPTAAER